MCLSPKELSLEVKWSGFEYQNQSASLCSSHVVYV